MLTPSQHRAVYSEKNSMIEAGAGSGKTTVLVSRYLHLVKDRGLSPSDILAITFTDKATEEMESRIHKALSHPKWVNQCRILTFHGFCRSLLAQFPLYADTDPLATVLPEADAKRLFEKAFIEETEHLALIKDSHFKTIREQLSLSKLHGIVMDLYTNRIPIAQWLKRYEQATFPQPLIHTLAPIIQAVFERYTALKNQHMGIDYDDCIVYALALLKKDPVRHALQRRFKAIMIDEFQDTDRLQWEIMQALCDDTDPLAPQKLFLVGDYKQSIYRFRGATPELMKDIHTTFQAHPDTCDVIPLTENFRTAAEILTPLNALFKPLFDREDLSLLPYQALTPQVTTPGDFVLTGFASLRTTTEEAEQIIQHLLDQHKQGIAYSDMAILTRRRQELSQFETLCESHQIPIQKLNRTGFYQQDAIVTLYALLCALIHPYQDVHWAGVLSGPLFGVSDSALFFMSQKAEGYTLLEKLETLLQKDTRWADTLGMDQQEFSILRFAASQLPVWISRSDTEPLCIVLRDAMLTCALDAVYKQSNPEVLPDIEAYLKEIEAAELRERLSRDALLERMRKKFEDSTELFQDPNTDTSGLYLLTVHGSKGLEFEHVYVPHLHLPFTQPSRQKTLVNEQGLSLRDSDCAHHDQLLAHETQAMIQESLRLFYVATTRAKSKLILTTCGALDQALSDTPSSFLWFVQEGLKQAKRPLTSSPWNTPTSELRLF